MRRFSAWLAIVAWWLTLAPAVQPQPRRLASPRGHSAAEVGGEWNENGRYVGGKWIEIDYGRPIKRGREPFGPPDFVVKLNDGAPVWRAGANQSTVLRTEVPLLIDGTRIEPGEYTVFIELRRSLWTLIISNWPAQAGYDPKDREAVFGAFHYMPNKDVLRTEMRLDRLSNRFEQLSWQFLDMTDTAGRLALLWDDRMASVVFRVAQDPVQ